MDWCLWCGPQAAAEFRMKSSWNFLPQTRCWCASLRRETDVFPGLQNGGHAASCDLGRGVPFDAVFTDVLLQLLVRIVIAEHRSFVEPGQLRSTSEDQRLLADAAAFHVDRGTGNDLLAPAGVSAGVLPFVLHRQAKRFVVSIGDYSTVGQLPRTRVCVEDDPWLRWRSEHSVEVRAPDQASFGVLDGQSLRGS